MKTIRISDEAHRKLTRLLGQMMARSGKPQTYTDALDMCLSDSLFLPTALLEKIDSYVKANSQTRVEVVEAALSSLLASNNSD